MPNNKKVILDLCGGTGSWSQYYKAAGYTVHVITLPEYDVTKTIAGIDFIEFQSPIWGHSGMRVRTKDVYGILAAPPCTMFSRARTTAKTPRDFNGALKIVEACLKIVWACRSAESLEFWALENPMGLLRQFMGNPGYSFMGWEFGDNHVKFTDLWGYFNKPTKKRGVLKPDFDRQKWALAKKPKRYAELRLSRADVRAITPPGFAKAFFNANK